jgi:hypothetical protein
VGLPSWAGKGGGTHLYATMCCSRVQTNDKKPCEAEKGRGWEGRTGPGPRHWRHPAPVRAAAAPPNSDPKPRPAHCGVSAAQQVASRLPGADALAGAVASLLLDAGHCPCKPPRRQSQLPYYHCWPALRPQPQGCSNGPETWVSSRLPLWQPRCRVSASGVPFWRC